MTTGLLVRPSDVTGAVAALAEPGARVLGGGTAIAVTLAHGDTPPVRLVGVAHLAELRVVDSDGRIERIGAASPLALVARRLGTGAIAGVAAAIGSLEVRLHGTLGGNLRAEGWPADLVPALWCAEATVEVEGPHGVRRAAVDLAQGLDLESDELIVAAEIPVGAGFVVGAGGPTPSRPAVRLVAVPARGRAVAVLAGRRIAVPAAAAALLAGDDPGELLVGELDGLVPHRVAAHLGFLARQHRIAA